MIIILTNKMSKALIVIFALVAISFASPMDKIKNVVKENTCAADSMAVVQPQIDAVMTQLKQVNHILSYRIPKMLKPKPSS